jgi:hypothetical protein
MSTSTACLPVPQPPDLKRRKPGPEHFCQIDGTPTVDAPAILTLHVGCDETTYLIRPVPNNFGEAFELTKLEIVDDGPAERGEVYHVLFESEFSESCECKGFLRWGHCKHLDSIKALRDAGKL